MAYDVMDNFANGVECDAWSIKVAMLQTSSSTTRLACLATIGTVLPRFKALSRLDALPSTPRL